MLWFYLPTDCEVRTVMGYEHKEFNPGEINQLESLW